MTHMQIPDVDYGSSLGLLFAFLVSVVILMWVFGQNDDDDGSSAPGIPVFCEPELRRN